MEALCPRRQSLLNFRQLLFNSIDDVEGGSTTDLLNVQHGRPGTVKANHIGLRNETVTDICDIPNVNSRAIGRRFDRYGVQLFDRRRTGIQSDLILEPTD